MRAFGLATLILVSFTTALVAQPPRGSGNPIIPVPGGNPGNAPPALNPNDRLDQLLIQWEARMKNVDSILVKNIERKDKDKDGSERVLRGEARFLKPNYAAIQLIRVDNPKIYEMQVLTGNFFYDYRPQSSTLTITELPAMNNRHGNTILSLIGGMGAAETKGRFQITLTKDVSAENKHFIYLEIRPKTDADKREFTRAQMVLLADSMMLRRLWFEQVNGNETTWDIPTMDTTTKLNASAFAPPTAPAGWKVDRQSLKDQPSAIPTSQPRIVRPSPMK